MKDHTILDKKDVTVTKKSGSAPRTSEEKYRGFHRRLITRLNLQPNSRVVNAEASKKSVAQRIEELDDAVGRQFDRAEFARHLMHRFADFARRTRSNVQCRKLDGKVIFSGDWRVAHLLSVAAEILGVNLNDHEIARALSEAGGEIESAPISAVAKRAPVVRQQDEARPTYPTFATRFVPHERPQAKLQAEDPDQPHSTEEAIFEEIPPTPDEVAAQGSLPCFVCGRLKGEGDHKRCA